LGLGCKASPHWGCWTQTLTHGCAQTLRWDISVCLNVHAAGVSANGQCRMADTNAESAGRYKSTLAVCAAQAERKDVANSLVLYIALRQASVVTANLAAVWLQNFDQTLTRLSLTCVQVVHRGRTLLLRSFGVCLKHQTWTSLAVAPSLLVSSLNMDLDEHGKRTGS